MNRFIILSVLAIAGMFHAGCGGSSGGGGSTGGPSSTGGTPSNPAPVINSLTSSKSSVGLNETFSITVVATDTDPLTYEWSLLSGPNATFTSGQNSSTANLTAPGAGGAGTMIFKILVTDSQTGQTTQSINVDFSPPAATDQHDLTLRIVDDPDPTAGDLIEAQLTKKGGGTPLYGLSITYDVVLKNGQTKSIGPIGVAAPLFRTDVTFGQKPGGGGDIVVSDLQSVTANVSGGATKTITFNTFNVGGTTNTSPTPTSMP